MADVTDILNGFLRHHHATSIPRPKKALPPREEFLKEAYRINAHVSSLHGYLRSIRASYLSASLPPRRTHLTRSDSSKSLAPQEPDRKYLTNAQRDQIDAESKRLLRELNNSIRNLADAEKLRQDTEASLAQRKQAANGLGALGRWAAGSAGLEKTADEQAEEARTSAINMHRESVLWYLRRKLEACGEVHWSMMETRLIREVEKSKSVLYKTHGATAGHSDGSPFADVGPVDGVHRPLVNARGAHMDEVEQHQIEHQLSPEQLQLFAKENQDMLKHYEDTLDQVRTAERSLVEISELQTVLANNLATQSAHIDQMVADSLHTTENVGGGNKQLKKAAERASTAKYVFYGSCAFSIFLVVYDLFI
ncbi:MAG: hypothetical protein M1838_003003 [Thelocarpon superellum]|nr:MAG: hypothetical protein M1838_003003 [Thelocarpon superellum]